MKTYNLFKLFKMTNYITYYAYYCNEKPQKDKQITYSGFCIIFHNKSESKRYYIFVPVLVSIEYFRH